MTLIGKVLFLLLEAAPAIVVPIAEAPSIGSRAMPDTIAFFPLTTWNRVGSEYMMKKYGKPVSIVVTTADM